MKNRTFNVLPVVLFLLLLAAPPAPAADPALLSTGQTVYVPAYSHVYFGDKEGNFQLTVTLSVRNTDQDSAITLTAVDYFDTDGNMTRRFLAQPVAIPAMASRSFSIAESDSSGGLGANFLVRWSAKSPVNAPIVESVMIGTRSQQGISFTSRGREIIEKSGKGKQP